MNANLLAVAFTVAALGLVAAFDVIPGTGVGAGLALLAVGGVFFTDQVLALRGLSLWRS